MFSLRGMVATAVASLALCHQTSAFVAPFVKLSTSSADGSSSTTTRVTTRTGIRTGATRMSAAYAPQNVQAAWDNHLAAFGGKDVDKILLDYDEKSVVTIFDQTKDEKQVFTGVEGARTLFTGLFESLSDMSDLSAPVADVCEESKMVFLIWRCPASGYLDATDTFVFGDDKKIYRQNVAFRTKG
eukprot:jgi/Undpi1/4022/HiC_scaffold_16.g07389.m1